jgi:hypothetical protein
MKKSNIEKSNQGINRRSFFKSGAVIAGGSILASAIAVNKLMVQSNSGLDAIQIRGAVT